MTQQAHKQYQDRKNRYKKICADCGIQISPNPHNTRCVRCSSLIKPTAFKKGDRPSIATEFKSGKDHPNYRFGTAILGRKIRASSFYKRWRNELKKQMKCEICGEGNNLDIDHHPKTFAELLTELKIEALQEALDCKELWSHDTVRILCRNCHKKTDTYTWRKGNILCP